MTIGKNLLVGSRVASMLQNSTRFSTNQRYARLSSRLSFTIVIIRHIKSRGMVILEIEKHYKGIDNLLGEHRWCEFLKNPTDEQKDCVSQIFYCLYKSDRETQKDGQWGAVAHRSPSIIFLTPLASGWKRINVLDAWFKGWNPNNKHIIIYSIKPDLNTFS
jgi:hypothetical protein